MPDGFKSMIRHLAQSLGTSRRNIVRTSARQGLALLNVRIKGVKAVATAYENGLTWAGESDSAGAFRILEAPMSYTFMSSQTRRYPLMVFSGYSKVDPINWTMKGRC